MDPDQTAPLGPQFACMQNRFEKFVRCSEDDKQMTFSDADFLGVLRVNLLIRRAEGFMPY